MYINSKKIITGKGLIRLGLTVALACMTLSCRTEDDEIVPSTEIPVTESESGEVKGFFLLNEGNMGSNKASLDYFDYDEGRYHRNIFAERNPGVVNELGDVGNDIQIYGGKLYAVINCSHLVEVMDVNTGKHIAAVSIPNCRYIVFDKGYAYVSSYAGPVLIDPNARLGYVARIDTASLTVTDTCVVGYQPEEMVIEGNRLYVANSGGYRVPNYDNTVSVIDLETFSEVRKIVAGVNLHRMEADGHGNIYLSSRGDYRNIRSNIYIINTKTNMVTHTLNLPASELCAAGDSMYVYSTEWNHYTNKNTVSYAIINTLTRAVVSRSFITDGTEREIELPYGLAVNPETREIFVTDAKDYINPGTLYCFTPDGRKKWSVTTGDIPAHIVFTSRKLNVINY
jgi:DNA-binding beta-propeller fold protein YncE